MFSSLVVAVVFHTEESVLKTTDFTLVGCGGGNVAALGFEVTRFRLLDQAGTAFLEAKSFRKRHVLDHFDIAHRAARLGTASTVRSGYVYRSRGILNFESSAVTLWTPAAQWERHTTSDGAN